jgi:hypothetical protein
MILTTLTGKIKQETTLRFSSIHEKKKVQKLICRNLKDVIQG